MRLEPAQPNISSGYPNNPRLARVQKRGQVARTKAANLRGPMRGGFRF